MDQQEAKKAILGRIKPGPPTPLPDVPIYHYMFAPVPSFIEKLIGFDGRAIKFRKRADALAWLAEQPELAAGKAVYSSAGGFPGSMAEEEAADPQKAFGLGACVSEGLLGVGETGSIWVTNESLRHPRCALLARDLFILLDAAKIIHGLHEAYAVLKLTEQQYGSFFSGPSATADIEAVHITGAQGPLSLTAVLYSCKDASTPPELLVNPNADKSVWMRQE